MKIISKVHTFIFFSKENAPSSYHECFERSIRGKMAPLIYTAHSGLKMEKYYKMNHLKEDFCFV